MTYLDALQETLAAEHAAVFVFGFLGAQTSQSTAPGLSDRLRAGYDRHRERRDRLEALVREVGEVPVSGAASYDLGRELDRGDGVPDQAAVTARALRVERDCGRVYGFLVASSPSPARGTPVDFLIDSALRELDFGGVPRRYPGR